MARTGKSLLDFAEKRIGEKYVLGALAPKDNGAYRGPWDCAEFCSWVIYQAGQILYGVNDHKNPKRADAWTNWFKSDAEKLGIIVPVEQAMRTEGAILLRYTVGSNIGHIAFSTGDGGTIEAHSSKLGVIKSTARGRRWDIGILIPNFTYSENKAVTSNVPSKIYRVTSPMQKGEDIKELQRKLTAKGFVAKVDGIYGLDTAKAVRAFQASKGLVPDGEAGPLTLKALGL